MNVRIAFAALLFAMASLFLLGCTQNSIPASCNAVSEPKLWACIYNSAVLEQNPFYCYSLPDLEQRKACIKDASSTAAKNALQKQLAIPVPEEKPPEQPVQEEVRNETPAQPQLLPECGEEGTEKRDSCLKSFALDNYNYTACENISDSTVGKSCVTEIAIMTKNVSACHDLAIKENFDLCNLYAKPS